MKKINNLQLIVIFLVALSLFSFVGEPDEINKALKTGDSVLLKKNMNSNIELVILEKENVYSSTQAEQILKQFFVSHKPVSFEVLHNGGNNSSQYYIGTLKTEKKTYRIYYLLKTKDNKTLLYQLRIESDE